MRHCTHDMAIGSSFAEAGPHWNSLEVDPLDRHEIPRHEVTKVICSLCGTEQDVQQNCINCGVCMGKYFCVKCKFFDDDVLKDQYHCDGCGICRTGGEENFFHCYKCGCCLARSLMKTHCCIERAMHHNCPVCFECIALRAHHAFGLLARDDESFPIPHALYAQGRLAICLEYGNGLIKRLPPCPCPKRIRIRWFGSFAMIVEHNLRYIFIL
ncbi:hypothetical protein AAC387_Pa01g1970 [Persea americana]